MSQSNQKESAETYLFERGEVILRFARGNLDLEILSRVISIDKVTHDSIYAYANEYEFKQFLDFRLAFDVLAPPTIQNNLSSKEAEVSEKAWDQYPSYEDYLSYMQSFASNYPEICKLDTIGETTEGRLLLVVKISDNVDEKEAEPEFLFTSTIHGDEVTGYMLMLQLIDHMLANYESDERIKHLIDTIEIWINPNANPDGTYSTGNSSVSGATRYNANNVDLNRNFPDPEDGDHPRGVAWQAETIAMMEFMQTHNFAFSANYHGGSEVMNYPWDTWSRSHCDEEWFIHVSKQYADTVKYLRGTDYFSDVISSGYISGYNWYTISGGRQDYTTYFANGREITIEVSSIKMPPASSLANYWEYNRNAMLNYIQHSTYGIHGIVYDLHTSMPVVAKMEIVDHDRDNSFIYSDSTNGYFHRLLAPGTYTFEVSAEGYKTKITAQKTLSDFNSNLWIDIGLEPGSDNLPYYSDSNIELSWSATNNSIIIESQAPCYYKILLYDLQGRMIYTKDRNYLKTGRQNIEIGSKLSNGLYICTAIIDDSFQLTNLFNIVK